MKAIRKMGLEIYPTCDILHPTFLNQLHINMLSWVEVSTINPCYDFALRRLIGLNRFAFRFGDCQLVQTKLAYRIATVIHT